MIKIPAAKKLGSLIMLWLYDQFMWTGVKFNLTYLVTNFFQHIKKNHSDVKLKFLFLPLVILIFSKL